MSTGVPRPVAVRRPALLLAAIGGALVVMARTTGSGWLVVILCGLVSVLVVGLAWPAVAVARTRIGEVAAPPDGTVGRDLGVRVRVEGRARGLVVRLTSPEGLPVRVDAPVRGRVVARPRSRGVLREAIVEVGSAAPLGFVSWRSRVTIALARPIEIGPAPVSWNAASHGEARRSGAALGLARSARGEWTRGTREYRAGDAFRLVHWPATARWGQLMVRELEDPPRPRLVVAVDLRGPAGPAEEVASRAAGAIGEALDADLEVELRTVEPDGPCDALVTSRREAGRRLARAVSGPPDCTHPPGETVMLLRVEDP